MGVTVEVVQTLFTSSSGHKAVALPEIKVCNYITTLVEYSKIQWLLVWYQGALHLGRVI